MVIHLSQNNITFVFSLNNSTKISFTIALLIAFFNFLLLYVFGKIEFITVLIFSILLFVFSFGLIKVIFLNYIKTKIKPIFRTIYEGENINENDISLEQINEDAITLQKSKNENISNLKKQIDFRTEFLANVSHELKTPLFSAQGYIETLLDGGMEDENINMAYLRKASKNIERLSSIVTDLDMISRIESNALTLKYSSFNIEYLIKDCKEDLELLADLNNITISINKTINKPMVHADKEKIKEVLINLVSNSIKYGKENGETIISIFDIEDKILIRIADNGLGIKEEQIARVFERFYRIDDNRSRLQGGSGLGLAIVKHFLEAHHQQVSVKSEYGIGSIFEFTLNKK